MPELPEVETIRTQLEPKIIDRRVISADSHESLKFLAARQIVGRHFLGLRRRGKYLIAELDGSTEMVVHLGMTGKFFLIKKNKFKKKTSFYYKIEDSSDKHDRLVFILKKNLKLVYNDVRKFGFIKIFKLNKIKEVDHLKILGPEPLSYLYNFQYFKDYLIGKNRKIKDLLMDQKFVSGLGNIYVNEILFLSEIRPDRKIIKLKDFEIKKVIKNTKKVLKKEIIFGGS